MALLLIDRTI